MRKGAPKGGISHAAMMLTSSPSLHLSVQDVRGLTHLLPWATFVDVRINEVQGDSSGG